MEDKAAFVHRIVMPGNKRDRAFSLELCGLAHRRMTLAGVPSGLESLNHSTVPVLPPRSVFTYVLQKEPLTVEFIDKVKNIEVK